MENRVSREKICKRGVSEQAKRAPRKIILESMPVGEPSEQLAVNESLDELLSEYLVQLVYKSVESGELVIEDGVVHKAS